MSYPDLPTDHDRLAAARLTGTVERLIGRDRDVAPTEAIEELREATTDPVVLGHVLGSYLVTVAPDLEPMRARAVALLRAAGADEATAATMAEWQSERYARQGNLLP
ncbi:hypothetical protein [Actinoplanes sp. N902-109]|uniref:hypothetical protein n=1 Tax=Actinoplanes sp. (strain N902-109) TaxID=649831 RepID=UPI0012F80A11|nr:hypothetical protein [Actinoplanes sp. N902-109]